MALANLGDLSLVIGHLGGLDRLPETAIENVNGTVTATPGA